MSPKSKSHFRETSRGIAQISKKEILFQENRKLGYARFQKGNLFADYTDRSGLKKKFSPVVGL